MIDVSHYRDYAADCVRQAQGENEPGDRNILLNVALAWLRLEEQTLLLEDALPPEFDDGGGANALA